MVYAAVRDPLRRMPRQGMATIHGIGFWDFLHTQKGGAANGIELHPLALVIPQRVPECHHGDKTKAKVEVSVRCAIVWCTHHNQSR